jgi:hypothetical protein
MLLAITFIAILGFGLAYVWKRGDLDWVRAVTRKTSLPDEILAPLSSAESRRAPQTAATSTASIFD